MVASYAYSSASRGHLRVEKGDVLLVASRSLKDWLAAQNLTAFAAGALRAATAAQTLGVVPANYVRAASESDLNALYGSSGTSPAAAMSVSLLLSSTARQTASPLNAATTAVALTAAAAPVSQYNNVESLLDDLNTSTSAFEQAVLGACAARGGDTYANSTLLGSQQPVSNSSLLADIDLLGSGPTSQPLQTQFSINSALSLVNNVASQPVSANPKWESANAKRSTVSTSSNASKKSEPEGEEAVAIADFTASSDTQLSFRDGQRLRILGRDGSGWWQASVEVEELGRKKTRYGWVPHSYIQLVSDSVAASTEPPAQRSKDMRSISQSSVSLSNAVARKNTLSHTQEPATVGSYNRNISGKEGLTKI